MVVGDALAPVPYFLRGPANGAYYSLDRHNDRTYFWQDAQVVTIEPGEDGLVYGPDGQRVSGAPPGRLIDIYV